MSIIRTVGFLTFLFTCFTLKTYAQVDSLEVIPSAGIQTNNGQRIINIDTYADRFDPQKALIYSAILPGAGQAYNQSYWKIPLVYGGFAVGIYSVSAYQGIYFESKDQLFTLLSNGGTLSPQGLNQDQLRRRIDNSRRQRDYWIILNSFWYLLQMVEAHVDAHLKEFDLNPELQVKLSPFINRDPLAGQIKGISLSFNF